MPLALAVQRPAPAAVLVLGDGKSRTVGVLAVLSVHTAVKLQLGAVIEDQGVATALVLILEILHVHDETAGGHLLHDSTEGTQGLVHLSHLILDQVDFILHGDELVADELAAAACQKAGGHDTYYDILFHFDDFWTMVIWLK